MPIKSIKAREILDSRGNPTVEVELTVKEWTVRAAVPSGASTGKHEALELRDKDKRYNGKGVQKAVNNINKIIAPRLIGKDPRKQREIDTIMLEIDGTDNKRKLGANAILGVSMAVCRAGAAVQGIPLYSHLALLAKNKKLKMPTPSFNILNGGVHAGNKLEIQEYMILPKAKNFKEALRIGAEVYHTLKNILRKDYGKNAINVGDEGGFAPPLKTVEEPIILILKAINKAGYKNKVNLAIDAAASEFYKAGKYKLEGKYLSSRKLIKKYIELSKKYPLISIEDPFQEDDFDSFAELTREIGKKVQIVGDDLLVTNPERIEKAIHRDACNALLLKVNQIGTVTEAIDAANLAMKNGWNVMVSHRSGETCDDFIADLVVGIGAKQIKSGAPCRGERLAKYNQLLRIEEHLKGGMK